MSGPCRICGADSASEVCATCMAAGREELADRADERRDEVLVTVAGVLRVISYILIGVALAEATRGRYGLAAVAVGAELAAWYSSKALRSAGLDRDEGAS